MITATLDVILLEIMLAGKGVLRNGKRTIRSDQSSYASLSFN